MDLHMVPHTVLHMDHHTDLLTVHHMVPHMVHHIQVLTQVHTVPHMVLHTVFTKEVLTMALHTCPSIWVLTLLPTSYLQLLFLKSLKQLTLSRSNPLAFLSLIPQQ
jgi:hypothetical protein